MLDEKKFFNVHTVMQFDNSIYKEMKERSRAEFGRRLRAIRTERAMSQLQIASALGITKNAITNWETGIAMPDATNIAPLCALLQCSAEELFGTPKLERLTSEELRHLSLYRSLGAYERGCVDALMEAMQDGRNQAFRAECRQNFSRIRRIPLRYSAGTGNPLDDSDGEKEYEYLRISRDVCMADAIETVTGDSMLPTFHDGDDLLIQRAESIEPGEIGIFVVAGDGYVKEYQPDGLHSHNKKYKTIHPSEDDNAHCIGRVLAVVTKDMRATEKESKILDEIYAE